MTHYTTSFPNTEDPIAESSTWIANTNTVLTNMRSTPGRCFGKALGIAAYDDSAARTTLFGDDVEITGTIFRDSDLDTDATHEVELLTRVAQTTTQSAQYESLFAFFGGIQCIRWFNNGGSQDFEVLTALTGPESLGRGLITGDRIRTRQAGSIIEMWVIEADNTEHLLGVYRNTSYSTGDCGIGNFTRSLDGGDCSNFCLSALKLSDEFVMTQLASDDFNRANESPLSGSGNWATSALDTLRVISNQVATAGGDGNAGQHYTGVSFPVDHWSEIEIATVGGGDFGAAICMQSNGDCILTTGYDGALIYVYELIGGSFNELDHAVTVYTAGQKIRARKLGSKIIISVDGSDVLTTEQPTGSTQLIGGSPGIFMFTSNSRADNWKGGGVYADYGDVPAGTVYTKDTLSSIAFVDQVLDFLIRNRAAQDNFLSSDSFLSSSIRGRNGQDVLTISDSNNFNINRNVIANDGIDISDGFISYLLRYRFLESDIEISDQLISLAGSLIIKILTSNVDFSDGTQQTLLRNLSATDLISFVDQVILQFGLTRTLTSNVEVSDGVLNFQLLTRQLQSAISIMDSGLANFIPGTVGQVDGSKIKIGFRREPIVVGTRDDIVIGGSKV